MIGFWDSASPVSSNNDKVKATVYLKKDEALIQSFVEYLKTPNEKGEEEVIMFDKLNTLVEVFQLYPVMVRKDKNQSSSIY